MASAALPRHGYLREVTEKPVRFKLKRKITCELFCQADSLHLQQLYTGFSILHRKGNIQLMQRICKEDSKAAHLKVVMNGELVLYYDAHDSLGIDKEILKKVNFYFKRSYSDEEVNKLNGKEKVFPLGLNYPVYSRSLDIFLVRRAVLHKGIGKLENLGTGVGIDWLFRGTTYVPRINRLEFYPDFNLPPKVLFMTQAWDPSEARSKDESDEREAINNTRANCIRLLKKEFGEHFFGGFRRDEYSRSRFRDCLFPDDKLVKKRSYMELLRQFPICVATTGLHRSIGWKMGEYVSYSKAIVTECLNYRVPGYFKKEVNYLDFVSPEGCVEAAQRLFQDYKLRCWLMVNNYRYYQAYLRPDSLVLNTLAIAMSQALYSQMAKANLHCAIGFGVTGQ